MKRFSCSCNSKSTLEQNYCLETKYYTKHKKTKFSHVFSVRVLLILQQTDTCLAAITVTGSFLVQSIFYIFEALTISFCFDKYLQAVN